MERVYTNLKLEEGGKEEARQRSKISDNICATMMRTYISIQISIT